MRRGGLGGALRLLAVVLLAASDLAGAHEEHARESPPPLFEPPAPGSYELPPVGRVGRHVLLDTTGARVPLVAPGPGQCAFVAFVYLSCGEACPLATASFVDLDRRLAAQPGLSPRVELVTVSFDPARDTPEAMGRLRQGLSPEGRWRFLTAASPEEITPVLGDFGQDAVALRGPEGDWTGQFRHVLKIFLVDEQGRIRNVYSTGLMDPRLLVNDALTLLDHDGGRPAPGRPGS